MITSLRVDYPKTVKMARSMANIANINPASEDELKIKLLIIDAQNTFCHQQYADLLVPGAWEDNRRLAKLIIRNIQEITSIEVSLDSHVPMQIFFPIFWISSNGRHPEPLTVITYKSVKDGTWRINPEVGKVYEKSNEWLEAHASYYTRQLEREDKSPLVIWPYHALLGSFGHALDSHIEAVVFAHEIARATNRTTILKGMNAFTEYYSALDPEIEFDCEGTSLRDFDGQQIVDRWFSNDRLIITGQAASHCVAATLSSILTQLEVSDPALVERLEIYLLDDCTSPVTGFEKQTKDLFRHFAEAGVHIVKSTTPMEDWPGMNLY